MTNCVKYFVLGLILLQSATIHGMWKSITSVSTQCPKFVLIDADHQGLGDMLTRVTVAAAIALVTNSTIVFSGKFWLSSVHFRDGYKDIFETDLGLPLDDFLILPDVIAKWNPSINREVAADVALYQQDMSRSLPCNSILRVGDFLQCTANSRHVWCLSVIGNIAQNIIRPLLDESTAYNTKFRSIIPPLDKKVINVVWHIRTGDVCLKCDNSTFHENINKFIESAIGQHAKYQNVVVHLPESRASHLFHNIPNTVFFNSSNPRDAVKLFLNADILVTTGSTFPNYVALFTKLHKPVVLQSVDKDATVAYHKAFGHQGFDVEHMLVKYIINEGRAIRLDEHGHVYDYQPADVAFILEANGAFQRTKS